MIYCRVLSSTELEKKVAELYVIEQHPQGHCIAADPEQNPGNRISRVSKRLGKQTIKPVHIKQSKNIQYNYSILSNESRGLNPVKKAI